MISKKPVPSTCPICGADASLIAKYQGCFCTDRKLPPEDYTVLPPYSERSKTVRANNAFSTRMWIEADKQSFREVIQ